MSPFLLLSLLDLDDFFVLTLEFFWNIGLLEFVLGIDVGSIYAIFHETSKIKVTWCKVRVLDRQEIGPPLTVKRSGYYLYITWRTLNLSD